MKNCQETSESYVYNKQQFNWIKLDFNEKIIYIKANFMNNFLNIANIDYLSLRDQPSIHINSIYKQKHSIPIKDK